jgi:hypothetical protein
MQQAGSGPLEAVMCGRYHDAFEGIDGQWRFSFRSYGLHDLPGDMLQHSRNWQRGPGAASNYKDTEA